MAKVGKKLMRYGAASLTLIYLRVSQCLPIVFSYAFMSALGKLAYYVVPRLRKVGMQNLDLAYGDQLTECERNASCAGRSAMWRYRRRVCTHADICQNPV